MIDTQRNLHNPPFEFNPIKHTHTYTHTHTHKQTKTIKQTNKNKKNEIRPTSC